MQLQMQTTEYNKLNTLSHFHQQRSHYRRMCQAKKSINFDLDTSSPLHYKFNSSNKYRSRKDRERKENNQKLVNMITKIHATDGILETMRKHAESGGKRLSKTDRGIKLIDQEHSINRENLRIAYKIKQVQPKVGTITEWKTHYKQHKSIERRLQREAHYNNQDQLRQTLSSLGKSSKDFRFLRDLLLKKQQNLSHRQKSPKSPPKPDESIIRKLERQMMEMPKIHDRHKINKQRKRFRTSIDSKDTNSQLILPMCNRDKQRSKGYRRTLEHSPS